MDWRIYYGDGSTFSDQDGKPEDAPCRNVQAIAQVAPDVGWYLCRSDDFYAYLEKGWQGLDSFGLWDYLAEPGLKIVKFGRTLHYPDYEEVLNKALNDPDLPRKSAWRKEESR